MTEKRTPEQWGEHYGVVVHDPDGWRRKNDPPWDEPITLADYRNRVGESTTQFIKRDAWDRMRADIDNLSAPADDASGLRYLMPEEILGYTTDQVIEMDQIRSAGLPQPTPEELVERLSQMGRGTSAQDERIMAGVVHAAESGGEAHMAAVAGWISQLPPAPPDPKATRYDVKTGRPAWDQNSILIELRVELAGRVFTARGTLDPFMFDRRFKDDSAQFEDYLRYFIRQHFGQIAVADEQAYAHFRKQLWISHPGDTHDMQRCAKSNYPELLDELTVRCCDAIIIQTITLSHGSSARMIGLCPCRCHIADGSDKRARQWAVTRDLTLFDEDQATGV